MAMGARRERAVTPAQGCAEGRDSVVLFLPGIGASGNEWKFVIDRLGDTGWDVAHGAALLPNAAVGAGLPTVQSLATAMKRDVEGLGYETVVVVAHSLGCFVGLELCRVMSGRVKAAVLVNGSLVTAARCLDNPAVVVQSNPWLCLNLLRIFGMMSIPAPGMVRRDIAARKWASDLVLGGLIGKSVIESHEQRRVLVEESGSVATMLVLWRNRHYWQELLSYAGSIGVDLLFVNGDADPLSSDVEARRMSGLFPNAEVVTLGDVGHVAPLEAPERVASVVRDRLR